MKFLLALAVAFSATFVQAETETEFVALGRACENTGEYSCGHAYLEGVGCEGSEKIVCNFKLLLLIKHTLTTC